MLLTTSKLIVMKAYTETGVQTVDAAESINQQQVMQDVLAT